MPTQLVADKLHSEKAETMNPYATHFDPMPDMTRFGAWRYMSLDERELRSKVCRRFIRSRRGPRRTFAEACYQYELGQGVIPWPEKPRALSFAEAIEIRATVRNLLTTQFYEPIQCT